MTLAFNICIALVLLELLMLCMGGGSLIFLALWLINLGTIHSRLPLESQQA